jgi:hypothetical protein
VLVSEAASTHRPLRLQWLLPIVRHARALAIAGLAAIMFRWAAGMPGTRVIGDVRPTTALAGMDHAMKGIATIAAAGGGNFLNTKQPGAAHAPGSPSCILNR